MNVELDSKMLSIVQLAVTQSLASKLDSLLPKMLEEVLETKDRYGHPSFVGDTIKAVVKQELEAQISAALAERHEVISAAVARYLDTALNSEEIAKSIGDQLSQLRVSLSPFKRSAGKNSAPPTVDNEDL